MLTLISSILLTTTTKPYGRATNQNGNTFYYVTNYRGDVVRMVDENGATVANYSYDPWGKVLSVSENAAVAGQPLGYAGYYYDRETKLYYLQARYYDPETARFISRDPDPGDQDDPITQNAYTYANDNPVMMMDPNGYFAVAIPVIYAAALAVLGVGLVYYAVQTLDAVSKLIEQSFARVKKRPKYKSKTELHHIVAQKAGKAEPARRILEKVGIGVNDKENLVRIKTGLHRRLHTTKYYQAVNTIIGSVYNTKYGRKVNRKRVVAALEAIRTWLEVQSFLSPF
ncbi:tRNA(Glu)-specific nuclease WapA [Anoxybacillus sp. P3H1B]|uniref:RHS repeat-associated core domain-containing protein n=1 Tax=Anoxybacillus sp. P3H1B TaxID=1769293 RepID=UPI0007950DEF|nr:RHS repeat-associated core domain-containing protein [Anoxybacillus sp. P3H1B]KXG08411.1 tRNA(Glu)-specific nuclease WapA [Anoxybacillus sp. P3H1B]